MVERILAQVHWWSFQLFGDRAGRITLTRAVRGSNEKLDDDIVNRNTLKRRYCKIIRSISEVGCSGYHEVKGDRISDLNLGGFGFSNGTSRVQYAVCLTPVTYRFSHGWHEHLIGVVALTRKLCTYYLHETI